MTLFREEVLKRQAKQLHGDISLTFPIGWHVIGFVLLGSVGTAALFLSTASYARTETAVGTIMPDRGVISIVPARPGVITDLRVKEGDKVTVGKPLAIVRAEETSFSGAGAQNGVLDALAGQDRGFQQQLSSNAEAAAEDEAQYAAQIAGFQSELVELENQLAVQRQLVATARTDFEQSREIAKRGFISRHDIQTREEAFLSRRQQLSALEQSRASKQGTLRQAERTRRVASARAAAALASLISSRAQVRQQTAGAEAGRGYILTSPLAGRVTSLTAHAGDTIANQTPVMAIVPDGARLRAELFLPTKAVGFLSPGQSVRLAVDAFPFEQFGTFPATIVSISSAPLSRENKAGVMEPMYMVIASIREPSVEAFGRRQSLRAGMTLSARIVTEQRSLVGWLFAPLFAVARR
ncbi:HlyD family efflux transporter periplasmic adaptor subunit [Sphingomonas sp. QA11]|uniref:HlyD family secretion protein n=1 Tax=Sphingomonas sp. QA11 TaxID=2950605 RepID=UPI00234AAD1D|nr:HlyD family efflux transporter periplasmic adaptor subunit [Sphingomonas sp. QA11]WCM25186.1 HlyD family efflux transporter periplasmic adaptor subunit [Sphingomonas sp. QA11]